MESVLLVIHLFLALAIIGLVLLQRSEGGGLGIGGGGLGGLATPQSAANLLSRATAICAGTFFLTSLLLGILASRSTGGETALMDALKESSPPAVEAPVGGEAQDAQKKGAEDAPLTPPAVPIAK